MKKIELDKLLKEKGRRYVLMLYCNWFISLNKKQLEYVLSYKEKKDGKERVCKQEHKM